MSVHLEPNGPARVLTLDRPERRNAVDRATASALAAAFEAFEADAEARVLVVTGAGGAFCAGADLVALDNDVTAPGGPMGFTRWAARKPTIAAIEGPCVAGGLEIALWCDLRVAADSATFGCLERRWGVPLIDGGTQRLPRVVGLGRALDLILTGRTVSAQEAIGMGLVSRVVSHGGALGAALALAHEVAAHPWRCLVADRASAYHALESPLAAGLALEAEGGAAVLDEAALGAARFARGAGRHGRQP
ncbi:MAG: crotonase/enoyl-CoA hydratase family protein [Polyangiaceae bacterium]|nr:crotonase/enoyl-CoA hydratase family protein [Polyangiaceae bacterium]